MESSNKLYKPRSIKSPQRAAPEDNSEWTTVKNSKPKKNDSKSKLHEKKRRNLEYRLNKTINEYLDKVEERNSSIFVMNLLEKNIQLKNDSRLKAQLNKILGELEKNYESIKTARSFGYFNKIKGYVDNNIGKLNKLVNEDNFHLHIGNNLLFDKDGVDLSTLDEYSSEMDKFVTFKNEQKRLAEEEEAKKIQVMKPKMVKPVFNSESAKIKQDRSFASLFK